MRRCVRIVPARVIARVVPRRAVLQSLRAPNQAPPLPLAALNPIERLPSPALASRRSLAFPSPRLLVTPGNRLPTLTPRSSFHERSSTRHRLPFLALSLDQQTVILFLLLGVLAVLLNEHVAAEGTDASQTLPNAPMLQKKKKNKKKKVKRETLSQEDIDKRKALQMIKRNQIAVEATNCGLLDAYFVNSVQSNEMNEDDHAEEVLPDQALFAIFDGHTGRGAVDFLRARFLKEYVLPAVREAKDVSGVVAALRESFVRADLDFLSGALKDNDIERGLAGACVVVAYIRRNLDGRNVLFVANAGDCRAILLSREPREEQIETSVKEMQLVATPLSRDHQASLENQMDEHPDEEDAVKNGRVKGFLEPSRGIGDGRYKIKEFNDRAARPRLNWHPPYTTAEPDVSFHELQEEDGFVVLATDGLWGQQDNDDVALFLESHERAMRLRLDKDFMKKAKREDPETVTDVLNLTRIRNPATALILDNLRWACSEWPGGGDYTNDSGTRVGAPPEVRMMLLPPRERRRQYDDTTVTVVRLRSVPITSDGKMPPPKPAEVEDISEDEDDWEEIMPTPNHIQRRSAK